MGAGDLRCLRAGARAPWLRLRRSLRPCEARRADGAVRGVFPRSRRRRLRALRRLPGLAARGAGGRLRRRRRGPACAHAGAGLRGAPRGGAPRRPLRGALFRVERETRGADRRGRGAEQRSGTSRTSSSKKRLFKAIRGQGVDGARRSRPRTRRGARSRRWARLRARSTAAPTRKSSRSRARRSPLIEVDDTARKAAKAGGAQWTDELRARAATVRAALAASWTLADGQRGGVRGRRRAAPTDAEDQKVVAFALDAIEAWLAAPPRRTTTIRRTTGRRSSVAEERRLPAPRRAPPRPSRSSPSSSSAPSTSAASATASSSPIAARDAARGRAARSTTASSATSATRTRARRACATTRPSEIKKNPLGIALDGCPLDEKISEMHVLRARRRRDRRAGAGDDRQPDVPRHRPPHLQRLHEGLHLPEAGAGQHPADRDRASLTDVLVLPWGFEIYGAAHALEPAQRRGGPYALPYNGKNVLVVGLGPGRLHARALPRERRLRRRRRSTG